MVPLSVIISKETPSNCSANASSFNRVNGIGDVPYDPA
jgi:hypothetical protein